MKDSEIYLMAAERAEKFFEYSCNAISRVANPGWGGYSYCRQRVEYSDLFASEDAEHAPAGRGFLDCCNVDNLPDPKAWRVLALCFMAAIAKSEGR